MSPKSKRRPKRKAEQREKKKSPSFKWLHTHRYKFKLDISPAEKLRINFDRLSVCADGKKGTHYIRILYHFNCLGTVFFFFFKFFIVTISYAVYC